MQENSLTILLPDPILQSIKDKAQYHGVSIESIARNIIISHVEGHPIYLPRKSSHN